MNSESINNRLNELSQIARDRMLTTNLGTLPNHNSFNFLTDAEKEERQRLICMMPSSGEKALQAKERLKKRIEKRNQTTDK